MKVNVEKILTFGLAFCLGGIVDSIIKHIQKTETCTYTWELRMHDKPNLYRKMRSYILLNSDELNEYNMSTPKYGTDEYVIEVKSNNMRAINKLKETFVKFNEEEEK